MIPEDIYAFMFVRQNITKVSISNQIFMHGTQQWCMETILQRNQRQPQKKMIGSVQNVPVVARHNILCVQEVVTHFI